MKTPSTNLLSVQRKQNAIFYILLFSLMGLLAFLSLRFSVEVDMTYSKRNTLTEATQLLLSRLDKPVTILVFASAELGIRKPINDLLQRYQQLKNDIDIQFIDPEREPLLVQQYQVTSDGEVVILYGDRSEQLRRHSEQAYSNALQKLSRNEQPWLIFSKGHGEREPHRQANHDMSDWIKLAEERGYRAQAHNLTALGTIPNNTAVLIIASPALDFLAGEVAIIEDYIDRGGNLLWLVDPGSLAQLDSLAAKLHLRFESGTVVDPTGKAVSIQDPRFTVVTEYPSHPVTQDFRVLSLFPTARAVTILDNQEWQSTNILMTHARSWAERGEIKGNIRYDSDTDLKGPLSIGVALTRTVQRTPATALTAELGADDNAQSLTTHKQQRIVVVGDGDFLSNTYVGNGGNITLGLNMLNWLSSDDQLLNIPIISAPDKQLLLTETTQAMIAIMFFIVIPLGFAATAARIWYKRRTL
ncbi:MAG: GldG family protein [Thiohalomonadales bacterium]